MWDWNFVWQIMPQLGQGVIIPQAIPPMIPALANYFMSVFKETPLLAAITVLELMNQARSVANYNYKYVEPMTLVGLFFLAVSVPSVIFLRQFEKRIANKGFQAPQ